MRTVDGGAVVVRLVRTAERRPAGAPLLRALAAGLLGVPEPEVLVGREPSGRPRLGGAAGGLRASVSHVRGLTAVAVSRVGEVGVDVERLRPLPAAALARRWFTGAEGRWVAARPQEEQPAAFLGLWTQKEAVGKALGTGLADGGMRRPVRLGALPGTVLLPVPAADHGLCTALPGAPEGFVLAVAAEGPGRVVVEGEGSEGSECVEGSAYAEGGTGPAGTPRITDHTGPAAPTGPMGPTRPAGLGRAEDRRVGNRVIAHLTPERRRR
ncbi:4'-phosphopantetheinyl transferase family protein [Streptomyces sp. NPDC015232]|uniref:4'-phosphopantetheinyl transferase family protein n=1 Tax=unclassified Streptomyces TaxID=2593676 RepID=UPI0036F98AA5